MALPPNSAHQNIVLPNAFPQMDPSDEKSILTFYTT